MIIPIRSARVKILPLVSSVAYPFLIASPDTSVPIALNIQKTGIVNRDVRSDGAFIFELKK